MKPRIQRCNKFTDSSSNDCHCLHLKISSTYHNGLQKQLNDAEIHSPSKTNEEKEEEDSQ